MKLEQAAQQALDALKDYHKADDDRVSVAISILQEALAEQERKAKYDERFERLEKFEQTEQEPVAWRDSNGWFTSDKQLVNTKYDKWTAVYAAPVRTKDLTDDEINNIMKPNMGLFEFARAVIQEFRRKNGTA